MEGGGDTMRRVSPAVCKSCTLSLSLSLSRASAQPITTACSTPRQFPKFQPAVKSEAGRYVATRIDTFLSSSCMKRAICPAEHDRVCYLDRSLSSAKVRLSKFSGPVARSIRRFETSAEGGSSGKSCNHHGPGYKG